MRRNQQGPVFQRQAPRPAPADSWSYTGFNTFREWLAQAEGFAPADMNGFGGDRMWSSISTTPAPLLVHPDQGSLAPARCAAVLAALADQRQHEVGDPVLERRVDAVRQLGTVIRSCSEKEVELIFR